MLKDLVVLYTEEPDIDEAAVENLVLETDSVCDVSYLEDSACTKTAQDESSWRKISTGKLVFFFSVGVLFSSIGSHHISKN